MTTLQEQLMKAGIVDEKRAKKIVQQKKKKAKQQPKGSQIINQAKEQALKSIEEKKLQGKATNLAKQKEAESKAIKAQIKQLITLNLIHRKGGDIPFQFADSKKIKKIYLTGIQQASLVAGKIAIVSLGQSYELVPAAVANKIKQRNATTVVLQNIEASSAKNQSSSDGEDDPYAEFIVPDDLMW
tara:strand:- start:1488 stop:2042 length:555 start_codon:yes stop_codon:yes gene_type:complete